ncbi:ORF36 [Ovine gammaherpesvirus 2]|uniref:ORF36 n=1 Tax=Ovine gammaherpesvirus 2 TaxID=10398 RepID=Q2VSK5_9GAMA|nr:ORF36 [Ovine gammaherpesvirus 2]AAX58071.1 ORF36 [Ovine gammaherpesvirus 2]
MSNTQPSLTPSPGEAESLKTLLCSGDSSELQPVASKSAIDTLATSLSHLQVLKVRPHTGHVTVCLPFSMYQCTHPPVAEETLLAKGAFGKVYSSYSGMCAKVFASRNAFFHETVMMDLVALARESSRSDLQSLCLQFYLGACAPCKTIWYPRYSGSLKSVKNLSVAHAEDLAREFQGLIDAVFFLNKKCGLFHGDICPANVLVEASATDKARIRSLILTDLGTAVVHAGNKFTDIDLKVPASGEDVYKVRVSLNPFHVCKDYVKPFCVLHRCYLLRHHSQRVDVDALYAATIGQQMALTIDCSALLQALLIVLSRILESSNDRTCESWLREVDDDSAATYFLVLLAPKLVLLNFLNQLWQLNLEVGVDIDGVLTQGQLPQGHSDLLSNTCRLFTEVYRPLVKESALAQLRQSALRATVTKLVEFDYFSLQGREPHHGLSA